MTEKWIILFVYYLGSSRYVPLDFVDELYGNVMLLRQIEPIAFGYPLHCYLVHLCGF